MSFFVLLATLAAPGAAPERMKAEDVVGEAVSVDADARTVTLELDGSARVVVRATDGAVLLRAKPGATTLADAAPVAFAEVAAGDRVLARGAYADDRASFAARRLVVMTHADVAQKHEAEQAEWKRRGITGVVTAVDAARGEITLRSGRGPFAQPIVLATAGRAVVYRRYAPDSVRFADARPSGLGEIQVGDELRALGDRGADGAPFLPEQIVFGTFRMVTGRVASVDAGAGTIVLRDDDSKRDVTVSVGGDARVKRVPPEMAAFMLRMRTAGPGTNGAPGGWQQRRGGGEDLLERLPPATLADLKTGDQILVSSTKGTDPSRMNAIAVVTGIEALLQASAPAGRRPRELSVGLPSDVMDLGMGIQ